MHGLVLISAIPCVLLPAKTPVAFPKAETTQSRGRSVVAQRQAPRLAPWPAYSAPRPSLMTECCIRRLAGARQALRLVRPWAETDALIPSRRPVDSNSWHCLRTGRPGGRCPKCLWGVKAASDAPIRQRPGWRMEKIRNVHGLGTWVHLPRISHGAGDNESCEATGPSMGRLVNAFVPIDAGHGGPL